MSDEGAYTLPKEESNKLFVFINTKDWEKAQATIKRNPNFVKEHCTVPGFYDGRFTSCMTPLHLACALEAPPSIIQALVAASPAATEEPEKTYGRIPLHVGICFGIPTESLTCLIKAYPKGCKVQDDHGRLPLHYACRSTSTRDEKNALLLLKAYPDSVKVADTNGFLPIHVATRSGNSRTLIRMLIRSAPETIVTKTRKGSTCIDCAKASNKFPNETEKDEIVQLLLRTVEEVGLRIQ